ncbi:hypothetical protein JXA88_02945 [Candidatus Fermentibacteria bacterium]|nr:hypothetical protein [Candidatus Fermentibacteria bacterium]
MVSAAMGAALGVVHASLALSPVAESPFRLEPQRMAWRFVARLCAVALILGGLIASGANPPALAIALVTGFYIRAAWLVWGVFR